MYAAPWIAGGRDAGMINEGLDQIFNEGEAYKGIKGNTTMPIEWFYKWECGKEDPELRRNSD